MIANFSFIVFISTSEFVCKMYPIFKICKLHSIGYRLSIPGPLMAYFQNISCSIFVKISSINFFLHYTRGRMKIYSLLRWC